MYFSLPRLIHILPLILPTLGKPPIPPGAVIIQVYLYDSSFNSNEPCTANTAIGCLTQAGTWNEHCEDCETFTSDGKGQLQSGDKYLSLGRDRVLGTVGDTGGLEWDRNEGRWVKIPEDFLYITNSESRRAFGPFWYASSKASGDGAYELMSQPSQEFPRGAYGLCVVEDSKTGEL
ncbi:hypothetical protein BDV12DRAFT_201216 [Aspergillus spectabilis]